MGVLVSSPLLLCSGWLPHAGPTKRCSGKRGKRSTRVTPNTPLPARSGMPLRSLLSMPLTPHGLSAGSGHPRAQRHRKGNRERLGGVDRAADCYDRHGGPLAHRQPRLRERCLHVHVCSRLGGRSGANQWPLPDRMETATGRPLENLSRLGRGAGRPHALTLRAITVARIETDPGLPGSRAGRVILGGVL